MELSRYYIIREGSFSLAWRCPRAARAVSFVSTVNAARFARMASESDPESARLYGELARVERARAADFAARAVTLRGAP